MKARRISKARLVVVCLSLVAVIGAMALLSQAGMIAPDTAPAIVGEAASYPVSADGYTHGSNIGRETSGNSINSASELVSAIQNNTTVQLSGNITLTTSNVQSIWYSTYSGTIYGNGYTVTATFPSSDNAASITTSNNAHKVGYGGLCGTLTGKIYDLNFYHTGGQLNLRVDGNNSGFAGGLVGSVQGGTIENVKVTLSNGSGGRVGCVKTSSGSGLFSDNYMVSAGALAGRIYSGTVRNVTIINNAWIEAGVVSGSGASVATKTPGHVGNVAGIIGPVQGESWSGSVTLDNIVIEGTVTSASLVGQYAANIGTLTTSTSVTVTNFFNKFKNTYNAENNGSSVTFAANNCSPTMTVSNLYQASGYTGVGTSTAGSSVTITNTVTVPDNLGYTVGFDPKATNIASSLVVVKSGITGGENYTATIANVKATPYVYTNNYAFSSDGGTVIFRNLSTTASDWRNSGGNFACTIEITKKAVVVTPLPAVNKWESSYVPDDYTPSGEPESYESGLYDAISNNRDCYLTSDINITGFRTLSYSGTLDGNGHTIYITVCNENSAETVGGLFGTLTGTVKNLRVVLYVDYTRNMTANNKATGIIAGNLNGGTVDNVYVYIPDGVTFGVTGGGQSGFLGAVAGDGSGTPYTIRNTTVDIDGTIQLNGNWVYLAAFVGRTGVGSSSDTNKFTLVNNIIRGGGHFHSTASNGDEPIYIAATTVMFPTGTTMPKIKIDGFINDFQGTVSATAYSMYGILTKNNYSGNISNDGSNYDVSNIYDYDTPLADINKQESGNNYIDISEIRSTVSTTVESSTIKVTPYFPAGDTTNLVLVAGDGTESVPNLVYGNHTSAADGNYKVVTVPKSAITAPTTVTLTEPITPATPIADLNHW